MEEKQIHYELVDDGGSNAMYLPVVLPIGTRFHHEYGSYEVKEYIRNEKKEFVILCDRYSKATHVEIK